MAEKRPFVIGLTGSIGMGKTETAKLFQRLGIPVYHADEVVHALYDKGGAAVVPIAEAFPEAVVDGRVDRTRLSARVANNEAAFQRLEAIVHPLVREAQNAFLAKAAADGAEFAVLDIPLLFETGGQARVDAVLIASAPEHVQRARVLAREGMTAEKFAAISARQTKDTEKRAKGDFVIETDKGLEHAFAQVNQILATLRERKARQKK